MKESAVFLVNITKSGRHIALISTIERQFVEDLEAAFTGTRYELDVTATPSTAVKKKNGTSL
jgi:antitoxin (DNA-binding transcriptional repressor) of toxin-antitoxin stability system